MTRRTLSQTEEREAWCMARAKAMDAAGASFDDYKREVLRRYPDTKFVDVDGSSVRTIRNRRAFLQSGNDNG